MSLETLNSTRQGLMNLNTGDAFTRVNGTETLVTPGGDTLSVNNRTGAMALNAPGARIEVSDHFDDKGFQKVKQLPGDFG